MTTIEQRIAKYEGQIAEEETLIASLKNEGAYKFGRKNPRGRQLHKQITQAEGRLRTARRRLHDARKALESR